MDHAAVLDKVKDIFSDVMDVDPAEVSPQSTADDVPKWDSISHVRLVMSIEDAFEVTFTNEEIGALQNLGDFVGTVHGKLS